ncbi:MAG: enolase [Candidatus Diapherotrites archaeon]|nr:enolase [Candidatus Diapherotrites archaeon]
MKIDEAYARVILNAKAEPTLEVVLRTGGSWVQASSPSGTSAGSHEAQAWPKADSVDEGVKIAKERLEKEVFPEVVGKDLEPGEVDEIIETVDGTERLEKIGGNAALALSIAAVKAEAWEQGVHVFEQVAEMYGGKTARTTPLENVIGGGAHGGATDIQEFLLAVPADTMSESILITSAAYREIKTVLKEIDPKFEGALTLESAFVTHLPTEQILQLLASIRDELKSVGYDPIIGIDVAANELWNGKEYAWKKEGVTRSTEEHEEYLKELVKAYGLKYLEDPFHEDAFEDYARLQKNTDATIVGDDLLVTNAERIKRADIKGALIKLNQAGTVSRTIRAVKEARKKGMMITVSHRSGETDDPFLAEFAVGVGADLAKIGAAGIRTVKLNQLLRIDPLI